jgi:hypothetical protein
VRSVTATNTKFVISYFDIETLIHVTDPSTYEDFAFEFYDIEYPLNFDIPEF